MLNSNKRHVLLPLLYLSCAIALFLVCAWWSYTEPETSRVFALAAGLPLAPMFVSETRNMVSVLPAYMLNSFVIYGMLKGNRESHSESITD